MLYKYTRRLIFIKSKIKIPFLILLIIPLTLIFFNNKKNHNNSIAVYLDNIESTSIPDSNSNYIIDKIICDNDAIGTWDNINWGLLVTNLSKRSNCKTYFRSKKDITITYDNNYIKNDIFEDIYDTSHFIVNDKENIYKEYITSNIESKNNSKYYIISNLAGTYDVTQNSGVFFNLKNQLTTGKTYSFSFEIKGNSSFQVEVGSEQTKNKQITVQTNWNRIINNFTANNTPYKAFRIYNWINPNINRTLEIRNLSLQEGEYDNYSTTILKEYDNLNNTLPTPTRENYTFLGWYTEPIEGEKISSETIVTEDTTYYAHWQYNEFV
mgnify:FL=1